MKKLATFLLITLTLTACSGKWQQDISDMPEELRQQHEEILAENLAQLEENGFGVEAALEVAIRYEQLGRYKKAIEYYEQVLNSDVNHIVALNNLADIYEEVEEFTLAASYIMRLFEVQQDNTEVVKDTVRILLKNKDALNAQVALDQFAGITLSDPESEYYEYYSTVVNDLQEDINEYLDS